jgi:hypothetical protein
MRIVVAMSVCLIDELETCSYVRFYIEICGQLLAGEWFG